MTATARDLLAMKNSAVVYTCAPETNVAEACRMLRERRVGCLVVERDGVILGLLADRDVVTGVAQGGDPAATPVSDVMTRDVEGISLEVPVDVIEATLRRRHIRHLPVVGTRGLLGVVSLGDIARFYGLRARAARDAADSRAPAVVAPPAR